jgi:hypothetical protein
VKLRSLKVYSLEHATLATLVTNINAFTAGGAVAPYAAGTVVDQELLGQHIDWNGTVYYAVLWYAEG